MNEKRLSGLVMPISSLPGPYGIGSLGRPAFEFVDFLAEAGQSYWQILPSTPTGFGDSPYQSPSALAGNPYFIDLDWLYAKGFLTGEERMSVAADGNPDAVDYGLLYQNRLPLLRLAARRGIPAMKRETDAFLKKNADWLPDYALFMALKEKFGMVGLDEWPDKNARLAKPAALASYRVELADDIALHVFLQTVFFTQWDELKTYANRKGVRFIGDMPIYVSNDSAEVWAHPENFQINAKGAPRVVAGVPPDYYAATGQLWGNPIYDWEHMKKTGYAYWLALLSHMKRRFDVTRIDHFRGFYNYWAVPAGEKTAMKGAWKAGPGMDFIKTIRRKYPAMELVAEDLGDLDAEVTAFFEKAGYPGMDVLIYAFDVHGDSSYLPHNTGRNRVLYTSTHDAPPFIGWLTEEASPEQRDMAVDYLRLNEREGFNWGALRAVWSSGAGLAMAPLQDVLGLGMDARVNIPGTLGGLNWRWRVRREALNSEVAERLRHITALYRRQEYHEPEKDETDETGSEK